MSTKQRRQQHKVRQLDRQAERKKLFVGEQPPDPAYIPPPDQRTGQFFTSADANVWMGDILIRMAQGFGAKVMDIGQTLDSGAQTPTQWANEVFDRGMHAVDATDGLTIPDDGIWVAGQQLAFSPDYKPLYFSYLSRAGTLNKYFASQQGVHGTSVYPASPMCIGASYFYTGDVIGGAVYIGNYPETNVPITDGHERDDGAVACAPMLWAAQLTSGRTQETWTTAKTNWVSTDIPTETQLTQQITQNIKWLRSRPAFRVHASSAAALPCTNKTWRTVDNLDSVEFDPYAMFDPINQDRFYCTVPGVYLVIGTFGFEYNAFGGRRARLLHHAVSGGTNTEFGSNYQSTLGNTSGFVFGMRYLNAGDWVYMQQWQSGGSTLSGKAHPNFGYQTLTAVHVSDSATITLPSSLIPTTFSRLAAQYTHTEFNKFGTYMNFLYSPPCCVAVKNSSLGSFAFTAGTWKSLTFTDTDAINNVGSTMHSTGTSPSRIYFPVDGLYLLMGQVGFKQIQDNGYRFVRIRQFNAGSNIGTCVAKYGPYIDQKSTSTIKATPLIMPIMTLVRAKAGGSADLSAIVSSNGVTLADPTSTPGIGNWFGALRVGG